MRSFKNKVLALLEVSKDFLQENGQVPNYLLGLEPNQATSLEGVPREYWNTLAHKMAKKCNVLIHISEAWVAEVTKEEWEKDKRPAGERENRRECLMIEAKSKEGDHAHFHQLFDREWDTGKIKWLGEPKEVDQRGWSRVMNGVYE